jgi:cytochrome c biogenesis protein CcmG/thiol:disulfide interchange protein DsbE
VAKVSPLVVIPPLIFAAIAGLFLGGMFWGQGQNLPSTFIGKQAPVVPVEGLTGRTQLTDADLRAGEVTLVNFWASWCPPCRVEHPVLTQMAADGLRVAGINFRDQADAAQQYLTDEGDPFFATGFDPRGRSSIDWGVTAPPETFIVAGDGTVLFRFAGPLVGSDYEQRFLPALSKALGN